MKGREKRWQPSLQAQFLIKLAELLGQGFTMQESLVFLKWILPKEAAALTFIQQKLERGYRIDETLANLGYSDNIISQIYLAQEAGRLVPVLETCGRFIDLRQAQTKKLKKLTRYPLFLLSLVLIFMLAIRQFFLPQLARMQTDKQSSSQWMTATIENFPFWLGGIFLVAGLLLLGGWMTYRQKSALEKIVFLHKLPILKKWVSAYYSAYFSRELSHLYASGQHLQQMIGLLKEGNTSALMKDFAKLLEIYANRGQSLAYTIGKLPFLKSQMGQIIEHGEKISQLPAKLQFFSQECFKELEEEVDRKMTLIQPLLFLMVGLLVLLIYLALMLPMLSMMNTLV